MDPVEIQFQTRQEIFGPVVAGRTCGDCTACCTFTAIDTPELTKKPGVTCEHCTSTGCGIYETRYPVCRSWQCLWKHIPSMPEEARPDQCGVMCVLDQPESPENVLTKKYIRLMVIDSDLAQSSELLPSIIEMFSEGDLPVWLDERDGELTLFHPSREIASAVLEHHANNTKIDSPGELTSSSQEWHTGIRKIKR